MLILLLAALLSGQIYRGSRLMAILSIRFPMVLSGLAAVAAMPALAQQGTPTDIGTLDKETAE